jgi:hypothetical protein
MKRITQIASTSRREDTDSGELIPSPWKLDTWRDVLEVNGKKQLGELQARLTSSIYTGPIVFTLR